MMTRANERERKRESERKQLIERELKSVEHKKNSVLRDLCKYLPAARDYVERTEAKTMN